MAEADQFARDFDHLSEEQNINPYPFYEEMRQRCPVSKAVAHGGFTLVARYDDVKRIYMDYPLFTSTGGTGIPPVEFIMKPHDVDPPEQTRYRKLLNPRFTVEALETERKVITDIVHELTDAFIEKGEAELGSEWVRPLLPRVILPMLGVPFEDNAMVGKYIHVLMQDRASDPEGCAKASHEMNAYLMDLVARRRGEPPRDDLLGLLIARGNGQRELTNDEMFGTLMIILFGGLDTTSSATLETMLYLAHHPEIKDRLRNEPDVWPTAIEEFVRFSSPVQGQPRTVTRDTEIEGVKLARGEIVYALNASANHDENVFPNAGKCVIDRKDNPHFGFGVGPHVCLGRNLARLELEILLKIALDRFGDWSLDADFAPRYFAAETRGMMRLPVRFTPGERKLTY